MADASNMIMAEGDAPATPSASTLVVYAKTDNIIYRKTSAGTETALLMTSSALGTPASGDLQNCTGYSASAQYIDLTAWTSDDTLSATEMAGNVVATNTGAGAAVNLTLPAGSADKGIRVIVTVAQYLRITADGTDKFRYGATEGAAGGYIRSNVIGTSFLLVWTGSNWNIMDLVGTLNYDE